MKLIKLLIALFAFVALFTAAGSVVSVPMLHNPEVPMMWFVISIFSAIMAIAIPSDIRSMEY